MELHRNDIYAFIHDPELPTIRFVWSAETAGMSDDDFKDALSNFAGFVVEYRPGNLLIDARRFRFRPTAALNRWRDEAIFPRYAKGGVRKFGFLLPEGAELPPPSDPAPAGSPGPAFAIRFFHTADEAQSWFGEGKG